MAIASSRRHGRNHVPPMARGAINPNAETALLLWRRCGWPRCGRLLLRRCLCRSRGGRCRCLRLRLSRRLGGRLLFSYRFLDRLGRGRRRRQLDLHRVRLESGRTEAGRNWLDIFRLRLVAVEREGNGHRRIGRQRQSARCAAGLPVGGSGVGARRLGFESHGVHCRRRLQRIRPVRCGRTCRKSESTTHDRDYSVHYFNPSARAMETAGPLEGYGCDHRCATASTPLTLPH